MTAIHETERSPDVSLHRTSTVNLKGAATLAFIGTLLAAALLIYDFIFDVVNVLRGLTPAIMLFPSLIYAFAALSLAIFFFLFQKKQS